MSQPSGLSSSPSPALAKTGIAGLDDVLSGGLTPHRLYLVEGMPGSGKTTLAMQFLLEGVKHGERVLYVTLSETENEVRAVAQTHGWSLDGITITEMIPSEGSLQPDEQYTLFHPSEIELGQTIKSILADVERIKPTRIVFDSLSELRLLAGNPLRYRRQILALKQSFSGRNCTVLLLDDLTGGDRDLQVQSIAHGVVLLEKLHPEYGSERRRLRVVKFRGVAFRGGFHDYRIRRGGLEVYPHLVAGESRRGGINEKLPSGVAEIDDLLGGGIERGTSTLISGAAGTGKSTLAAKFGNTAAERGQHVAMFVFDESPNTLIARCAALGMDLNKQVKAGNMIIRQVDPAELSPGEFTQAIRDAVEKHQATTIILDSLNGYLNAMPGERFLIIQLHEMLMYLGNKGVATILIGAHQGLIGSQMVSPVDASYLADAIILLRYFEAHAEVRQAISVVKKRGSEHERTIREFKLSDGRIQVGPPLKEFRGVLTGVPSYDTTPGSENARTS